MDPPLVSPQGTARTKMPLILRPMAGDLGPLFDISYDSGGGNGLLGQGWDMDVPMIAVDTKWGVPAYDGAKETETYLFGGRELLAYRKDDQALADPYLPHRTRPENRTAFVRAGELTEFRVRRDEGYERVIRHGASPSAYWWEVVRKSGVREIYGADPETGNIEENAVRRSTDNAIFQWGRTRLVDLDGNMTRLTWEPANCLPSTLGRLAECRSSLRVSKITYNDHASVVSPPAKTDVSLSWSGGSNAGAPRPDQIVNARYGVPLVTEYALKSIRVSYGGTFFSEQRFRYRKSLFGKSLLSEVIFHVAPETLPASDFPAVSDDELIQHHCGSGDEPSETITRLDLMAKNRKVICLRYHDPLSDHPQVAEALQPRQEIPAPAINAARIDGAFDLARRLSESLASGSVLGTNSSNEIGGSLYLGFAIPPEKALSAGVKTGYLTRNSEGRSSLVDLTGDGIPDLVVAAGNSLRICEGKHAAGGHAVPQPIANRAAEPPVVAYDATDIGQCKDAFSVDGSSFDPLVMKENGSSFSLGAELFVGAGFVGAAHTTSDSARPIYFADVDGDGLADIVSNGTVYYNQGKQVDGRIGFSQRSRNMIDPSMGAPAVASTPADELDKLIVAKAKEDAKLRKFAPLMDIVQVWRAPMDGLVAVNGRQITKATEHTCPPGLDSCVKQGDTIGAAKLRIEHSPRDSKIPATFCFHAPLQPGEQATACKNMADADIAEQFTKINTVVEASDRPLLLQVKQGDAIYWRMTSDDRLRFPWVDLDIYVSYLSLAQHPACGSTDVKPLDCGARWKAVLGILNEYAALPGGPAKSALLRERLAACVVRWPDGSAPGGASKKIETHGLVCDELGLSPFFFDLARDSATAGTLHDDTKLPLGNDANAMFSGSFEMPNGMGPMRLVLVTDPVSPARTDIREVIEPADTVLAQSFFTELFRLDVAGKCVSGTFNGVAASATIRCAADDSHLTVAWKSEPFVPEGGRVRFELRALFDPENVDSPNTAAIDWSKLIWREQPRVVITPVNATAWPGDAAAPGTWIDPPTDLATRKSEFGQLSKLPSVVLVTPHFRNRFLKRIDADQVGKYRRKQGDGTFLTNIAQGSSGSGKRRGRIKKEREYIQASTGFNYLIAGENRTGVPAAEGKRRFDPIVDSNGYLLPGACDPAVGVSCTYEYRLAHVFRTFEDPSIVNDLRTAFTFEVEAFVNGRRVSLRPLGEIQNTSKKCQGEGSSNTDEDDLVPATPINRRIDCVVSGQADPMPAPDPHAKPVTGFSFDLTDGNEVTGREKVFAFEAKPGDLLHLISIVRPRWNQDTKAYSSCLTPLQCPGPQMKPRSVANLLATDQDGVIKPWRPMMQTEFRLGVKATRTAADGTTSVLGLGLAAPSQGRLDVARLFAPLYFNEDHELLQTSNLPTDFRGWSRFATRAVEYDADGTPLPALLPTPGLTFVRTEDAPASSFAGSNISPALTNRINTVADCTATPCPAGVQTLATDYDRRMTYPFAMRFHDPVPSETMAEVWCKSFPAGSEPALCTPGVWKHTNYADLPATCGRSSHIRPCFMGPDKKIWITPPADFNNRTMRQTSGHRGPERFGLDRSEILSTSSAPGLPAGAVSIFAPPLVSRTTSWSATGSIAGAGIGAVTSESENTTNYLDINGDGYPDPIVGTKAFSSGPTGAPRTTWLAERSLAPLNKLSTALQATVGFGDGATTAIRENVATAAGDFAHGALGDTARSPLLPESVASTSGPASPEARLNVGVNLSFGAAFNTPNQDLVDLNGDGLPDTVATSNDAKDIRLAYNVGHKMVDAGTLNIFESLRGLTLSGGFGLNFGYKDQSGAFGGGVALSHNDATTRVALIDVNGDGLVDVVAPTGDGKLNVAFNNGWTFENAIPIPIGKSGEWRFPNVGASESTVFGLGAHYTFYIGPLCLFGICYIVVNPALDTSDVLGRTLVSVQDVNGDGLIDFVSTSGFYRGGNGVLPNYGFPGSKAHEKIAVHLNGMGKADKLKTIINSTGSTIGLDYAHVGNEQIHNPKTLYALSEIRVADGFRATNAESFDEDVLVTRIEYKGGVHDRAERQFLGFETIVESAYGCADLQPKNGLSRVSLSGDCQNSIQFRRRIERHFANDSIYTAGLLLSEELTTDPAAAGGARPFHRMDYEYELRSHDASGGIPASLEDPYTVCGLSGPDDSKLTTEALDEICLGTLGSARTNRIATLRIAAVDALGNTPSYTDATITGRWAPKHLSPQLRFVRKKVFEKGDRALRSAVLFDNDAIGNVVAMVDFGHIRNTDDTIADSDDDYRVDIVYKPIAPDLTGAGGAWKTAAMQPLRDRPQRTVVRRGARLDAFARILRSRSAVYQPVGAHVTALCHVLASDPQPEELAFAMCERLGTTSLAGKANPADDFGKAVRQAGYTPGDVVMTRITGYNAFGSPLGTLSPFNHRGDWIERIYGYDGDPLRKRPTEITEMHCLYRPDLAAAAPDLGLDGPCRRDGGTRSPAVIVQPILTSSAKYDPHHAKLHSETDINRNMLAFGYDGWGRMTAMLSSWDKNDLDKNYIPQEARDHCATHGMTSSCSIMMHVAYLDHRVDAVTPWKARVARYVDRTLYAGHNTSNAALIETVSYVDGLGRAVMTTRDADVCDSAKLSGSDRGWCLTADVRPVTASGLVARDALGRVLAEYYPVEVPSSAAPAAPTGFDRNTALEFAAASAVANPAALKKTRYMLDDAGRVVGAMLPDFNTIRLDHAIDRDEQRAGISTRFRTTMVAARCSAREYLRDARGLITTVIEDHGVIFRTNAPTEGTHQVATCNTPGDVARRIAAELDTATDERFAVSRYEHDPLGQLTDVIMTRDRPERVATGTSMIRGRHIELGHIRIAYDNVGRRVQITDPDRGIDNITFDGMSNATSRSHTPQVRGASGASKVVLQEFDTNRVVATLYPGAPELDVHYLYDGFKDLDWSQWTRERSGDGDNRVADWLEAEVGDTCDNCLGRLVAVRDGSGLLVQRYDVFGQPQDQWRSLVSGGTEKGRFHTGREYDRWGVMKSERIREYQPVEAFKDCLNGKRYLCDFDETVRFVYNQAGQVHRVEYDNATFAAFAYDAFGAMAAKWTVDGTSTRYTYNSTDRRLDRLTTELSSGAKIQDVTYSYDPGGNILRHVNNIPSANPADPPDYLSDFSYGYDAANRIASFKGAIKDKRAGDKAVPGETYGYDTLHRMQSVGIDTIGAGTTTRNYQYADELTVGVSHPLHAPRLIEEREPIAGQNTLKTTRSILHYDDWGNLNRINRTAADGALIERRALHWDVENRLASASIAERDADKPDTTIQADYRYDHAGRRTTKTAPRLGIAGAGDDTILYATDFFARRWNQNTASVHVSAGQARIGSVRLTRTQQGTERYAYLYHSELPNGSVTAVTRPTGVHEFAGELIEHLEYKPYGEPIRRPREIGPIASNRSRTSETLADIGGEGAASATDRSADRRLPFYAYSGKEYDLETGYLYFGARYYDPGLAMWISADPGLLETLDSSAKYLHSRFHTQNISTYLFSSANPLLLSDPNGRAVEITFDPQKMNITARDLDNANKPSLVIENVFSGGKMASLGVLSNQGTAPFLSIPPGSYYIVEYNKEGHPNWFRLEPIDSYIGDDKLEERRGEFRLHPGQVSYGCVTVCKLGEGEKKYEALHDFITATKVNQTVRDRHGLKGELGFPQWIPLGDKYDVYGTLKVLPPSRPGKP